jgi:peptidyl-prolyl cis-trans isomerase SurA
MKHRPLDARRSVFQRTRLGVAAVVLALGLALPALDLAAEPAPREPSRRAPPPSSQPGRAAARPERPSRDPGRGGAATAPVRAGDGVAPTLQGRVVERIAAVINEEVVLLSELEERTAPFIAEMERQQGAEAPATRDARRALLKRQVLEALVDERLLIQQAQQLKLGVTSEEIDRALEEIRKQNNVDMDELHRALKQQGMTMAQYRQDLRRQILRLKVVNAAVRSRISVSDEEIRSYYEQNVRKAGGQRAVRASHIFLTIPTDAAPADVEKKRRLAAELAERARRGQDFAKLARQYSEDAATKEEGGDLGFLSRGSLPPVVEEIVFGMDLGEVSGPIRAARGFHVIKLLDRKDEGVRPLAQIREQLRQQLYQQEMEKATKNWLAEIRKKAHVELRP